MNFHLELQLFQVAGCRGLSRWPLGYKSNAPPYTTGNSLCATYLQWLWCTTENWPAGRWYMYWVEKERDLPKSFDFCHLRVELMDFLSRHTHGDKTCQAHWTDIQKKIQKCFTLPTGEILSGKIAQDKEESLVRRWAEITPPDFFWITKENTVVPRPTLYLC